MVYPSTVLVVAIGVVVLMLTKVIPTFEKMFADFGGELPGRPVVVRCRTSCSTGSAFLGGGRLFIAFFAAPAQPRSAADRRARAEAADLRRAAAQAVARFTRTLGR
jgi:type IV pilus assembly protein PilC